MITASRRKSQPLESEVKTLVRLAQDELVRLVLTDAFLYALHRVMVEHKISSKSAKTDVVEKVILEESFPLSSQQRSRQPCPTRNSALSSLLRAHSPASRAMSNGVGAISSKDRDGSFSNHGREVELYKFKTVERPAFLDGKWSCSTSSCTWGQR